MNSRTAVNIGAFPAFLQDRRKVRTAIDTSRNRNGGRGTDLLIFAGIRTHSSRRLLSNTARPSASGRRRRRLRPQFGDQSQNLLEHLSWDGDLGHLERDVAAVADNLCADLDQLLLQARQ